MNIKNKIKLNITLYNNVNLNENIEKLKEIENINKQIKNKIKYFNENSEDLIIKFIMEIIDIYNSEITKK